MAVSVNAAMTAGNQSDTHAVSGATSFSTTGLTIAAGSNRYLTAVVNWGNSASPASRSVTWNGVAMTELVFQNNTDGGGNFTAAAIYGLVNPATGANTLAGSWTGSTDCYASAVCFNGADQSTGIDAAHTTSGTGLTLNVTGTTDGATLATHIRNGSVTSTTIISGGTQFWEYDANAPGGAGAYRVGLNGTNAYDFNSGSNTGTFRCTAGVHVIAASGSGVSVTLTGQAATFSAGTLASAKTVALSGQAATAATGTLVGSLAVPITGQSMTASQGTLSPALALSLSGQAVTLALGTLAPALAVSIAGQEVATATGTVTPSLTSDVTVSISGLEITITTGSVSITGADAPTSPTPKGGGFIFSRVPIGDRRKLEQAAELALEVERAAGELDIPAPAINRIRQELRAIQADMAEQLEASEREARIQQRVDAMLDELLGVMQSLLERLRRRH